MKHIIRKAYSNFEKEENWLNEMSSKGMALTGYSWCRYVFEDCENGEYIYRIELLDNLPKHPLSIEYIKFLEDTGVEFVASYMRWVYFRKKSSEGNFDLYSDLESRLKHYKKISYFWTFFAILEFSVGFLNILIGIINVNYQNQIGKGNVILGIIVSLLGAMFLLIRHPAEEKIKKLSMEKEIRE